MCERGSVRTSCTLFCVVMYGARLVERVSAQPLCYSLPHRTLLFQPVDLGLHVFKRACGGQRRHAKLRR